MTVVKASKADTKKALAERAYWQELADLLDWKIYGWSDKSNVSYFTDDRLTVLIEMTSDQRDDIVRAIKLKD
jgi:hypothetical protein